jgi:8-oxo-dGTP diphosphatase
MAMSTEPNQYIHVAAAALLDDTGRVLLTQRKAGSHLAGLWEFPGGKVEAHDDGIRFALIRELQEELGITPTQYRPLIRVRHCYGGRGVLLDVWQVSAWDGEPHGREGQPLEWVPVTALGAWPMPAADVPVVRALQLPGQYLITPEPGEDSAAFLRALEASLIAGQRLVQLRAPRLDAAALCVLTRQCLALCHAVGARLLLNASPALALESGADGVHLNSRRLLDMAERPLPAGLLVGASCHHGRELQHAARIGADFAVLGPVRATASHPQAQGIGWQRFYQLTDTATLPVYALGGMRAEDQFTAWRHGAQGIAAIRGLWRVPE